MKWAYSIQPKIKAALLLAIICLAVLINMLFERKNISNINESFVSIYEDRLLPATYVFKMTDHLYQKRLILEPYFRETPDKDVYQDRRQISDHNEALDTLLKDFEATYLVENEDQSLQDFERELLVFNDLENKLFMHYEKHQQLQIKYATFVESFERARNELKQLTQIQIDIGKKLEENSQRIAANTNLLTNMDAMLIIVMGLVIQVLIFTSKTVQPQVPQKHELN